MTLFKFFVHWLTLVIRKRLTVVLCVVATILTPTLSEGSLLVGRKSVLKFSDSSTMLWIKSAQEFCCFLPLVSNSGIDRRFNFEQDADIGEGFSEFSGGGIKIDKVPNLSVSIFSQEVIDDSSDANAKKKIKTHQDQDEEIPIAYIILIQLLPFFVGCLIPFLFREQYWDRYRTIRRMMEAVDPRLNRANYRVYCRSSGSVLAKAFSIPQEQN